MLLHIYNIFFISIIFALASAQTTLKYYIFVTVYEITHKTLQQKNQSEVSDQHL